MTFDPESDRQSAFNEGVRHVGRTIVGLINVNLGNIDKAQGRILQRLTGKGQPDG